LPGMYRRSFSVIDAGCVFFRSYPWSSCFGCLRVSRHVSVGTRMFGGLRILGQGCALLAMAAGLTSARYDVTILMQPSAIDCHDETCTRRAKFRSATPSERASLRPIHQPTAGPDVPYNGL
jgi:hypothetical protein